MKQKITIVLCSICFLFFSFSIVAQEASIDLELNIRTNSTNYGLYQRKIVTVELTNNGADTARNVVVSYFTDTTLAFVQIWSNPTGTTKGWDGTWVLESVAPNERVFLSISYLPIVDYTSLRVMAQVAEANGNDIDSTPGNASFSGDLEDDEDILSLSTFRSPPGVNSDLALRIEPIDSVYSRFRSFQFRVIVTNNGLDRATNVRVNASAPNGFLIGNGFRLEIGDLAVGDSSTRITNLYMEEYLVVGESILTATVSSDQIDNNPNNDSDTLVLNPAIDLPYVSTDSIDLGIIITSGRSTYQEFEQQDFTIKLFNRIPTEITLVRINISPSSFSEFKYAGHQTNQGAYAILEGNWDVEYLALGDTAILEMSLFPTATTRAIELTARAYCNNFHNNRKFAYNSQQELNCTDNSDTIVVLPAPELSNSSISRSIVLQQDIYPNPAQYSIFLELERLLSSSEQVVIYNDLGQEVKRQAVYLEKGFNRVELNIQHLSKGIYLLKLEDGTTKRFVRN